VGILWQHLKGGRREDVDPRPLVEAVGVGASDAKAWNALFDALYHQGDVDSASYAAVPLLVRRFQSLAKSASFYSFIAAVEVARHNRRNPGIPIELTDGYAAALHAAGDAALGDLREAGDEPFIRVALSVVALSRGAVATGALLSDLTADELTEILDNLTGWSELFGVSAS
jgi:hypothetical protein